MNDIDAIESLARKLVDANTRIYDDYLYCAAVCGAICLRSGRCQIYPG